MFDAFLADRGGVWARQSVKVVGEALLQFRRWAKDRSGVEPGPQALTRTNLRAFHQDLVASGRSTVTANKRVQQIQNAWRWLAESDEYEGVVPMPKTIDLPRLPVRMPVAPTWAEMDRCIRAAKGWQQQLAIVLRFTGLRVQEAMGLRRTDVDLDLAVLHIPAEVDKIRIGRSVPLSAHLVQILKGWDAADPWLVPCGRRPGVREREARSRDLARAWTRAGVREPVWMGTGNRHGAPHHAFRRGLISELKRAGADPEAREYLVGHGLSGVKNRYLDPDSYPMRATVALIPPLVIEQPVGDAAEPAAGIDAG